ncbi:MAG TPA: YciI family protein [Candidatus Polarisedimenticolaceae bacterium]
MTLWARTIVVTALPADAAPAIERHVEHLRALRREGRLRVAGSFRNDDGFLDIFEAKDLLEAEALARSSPLVEEGLCAWTVREWREIEGGP